MVWEGFAGGSLELEGFEAGEGAGELAIEGDFVAEEELQRRGGIRRRAEGEGGADGGRADGGVLENHVAIEGRFLDAPDAVETPAGSRHGFDKHELSGSAGLMFVHQGIDEFLETLS